MGMRSLAKFVKIGQTRQHIEVEKNVEGMFEHYPDAVIELDVFGRTIYANKALKKVFGYDKEDIFLDRLHIFLEPNAKERKKYFDGALKGEAQTYHATIYHKNGQTMYVEINYIPVKPEKREVEGILVIAKDMSLLVNYKEEAKLVQKKLDYMENYDVYTKLPNRQAFEHKIDELIRKKISFSCMLLDINRLRQFNGSLGQEIGDQIIREYTAKITTILDEQSYFTRFAGDIFGILVWNSPDTEYLEQFANKIINLSKESIIVDSYELVVTSNIGISILDDRVKTKEDVIRNTEVALFYSKELGKSNYAFYAYDEDNRSAINEVLLEKDLRKAIQNEEFTLHFQPRVNPVTGKIVSAEALVRWNHPQYGFLMPGQFIPAAEDIGFIHEIGDWVLSRVCDYLNEWRQKDLDIVPVSINVTSNRFVQKGWKQDLMNLLEQKQISPELIEFEITETTLIKYEKVVEEAIYHMRDLGFKIALDDFGTGYSSLTYLNKFSVDTIKIDRSFVAQAIDSEEAAIIIKSLIYMAKGLNMNLVAEGVETFEQLSFLKQQECQEIQGYIYSKPVSDRKFEGLLKRKVLKPYAHTSKEFEVRNRRNYFRVPFPFPLKSKMSITQVGGKNVFVGSTEILVEDISAGGLRFLSTINLPVRPDIVCNFEVVISGKVYRLDGSITWKEDVKEVHRYGVLFMIGEVERDHLTGVLNKLLLALRSTPYLPDCDVVDEDPYTYLRKQLTSK